MAVAAICLVEYDCWLTLLSVLVSLLLHLGKRCMWFVSLAVAIPLTTGFFMTLLLSLQCLSYTTVTIVVVLEALICLALHVYQRRVAAAAEKKFFWGCPSSSQLNSNWRMLHWWLLYSALDTSSISPPRTGTPISRFNDRWLLPGRALHQVRPSIYLYRNRSISLFLPHCEHRMT